MRDALPLQPGDGEAANTLSARLSALGSQRSASTPFGAAGAGVSHWKCYRSRMQLTRAYPFATWGLGALVVFAACSGVPGPPDAVPSRPTVSRAECVDMGGQVVGDIGDGAIHRPGFLCANGEPPLATVQPLPAEPIATEGEVCCGQ